MKFNYTDFISFICIICSIPLIILKFILLFIPTLFLVSLSIYNCNNLSTCFFITSYGLSFIINKIEKYLILFISILFYPIGLINYYNNYPIISFFRNNITSSNIKYYQMHRNIINACEKEGFCEVFIKILVMWSFLPTYRHAFLNNPILFEYKMHLTNQQTQPYSIYNITEICSILFSYINKINLNIHDHTIDNIGFTPNYSINIYDKVLNYDNLGLQVCGIYTTIIHLEYIYKKVIDLFYAITNNKYSKSIMYRSHPIYNYIYAIKNIKCDFIPFETNITSRINVVDLLVDYDDMYHVISGKVEVNIANGNIIEHPMLCLTHDGYVMQYVWNHIDYLFNNKVMVFLYKNNHPI